MTRRRPHRAGVFLVLALVVAGAIIGESALAMGQPVVPRSITRSQATPAGTPAAACPVTPYADGTPDDPETKFTSGASWTKTWFGSDGFWAGLSPSHQGEWYAGPEGQKVMWVRPGRTLTVEGRRLDGDAPPLEARIPDGYHGQMQASGLTFPTEGCWEVIASAAGQVLRFVVLVHPAEEHPFREGATPSAYTS